MSKAPHEAATVFAASTRARKGFRQAVLGRFIVPPQLFTRTNVPLGVKFVDGVIPTTSVTTVTAMRIDRDFDARVTEGGG